MDYGLYAGTNIEPKLSEWCDLYKKTFTANINFDIARHWYYSDRFNGVISIAEDAGKIYSCLGAVTFSLHMCGKHEKAAMLINAMTDNECPAPNAFYTVTDNLLRYIEQQGCKLVIVFPNPLINPLYTSMFDFKVVNEIPTMVFNIDSSEKIKSIGSSEYEIIHGKDIVDLTILLNRLQNFETEKSIYIDKGVDYIKWRYFDNPSSNYNLLIFDNVGWVIYKYYQDEMNVVEFSHSNNVRSIKKIVDCLKQLALKDDIKRISIWSPSNTKEHATLEMCGFINKQPIRYFDIKNLGYDGPLDVFDSRNWKICMGDHNAY